MKIAIKRIYDKLEPDDGYRVLVDRLWPRGITKEEACLDCWAKELAPSPNLRQWFNHQLDKWDEFKALYWQELQNNRVELKEFKDAVKGQSKLTLLYAAKDSEHNHALILEKYLRKYL